ncbi:MAG: 5-formyltetrahydrofolate cyclo-ligase [Myxococcota bacterium]
MIRTKEQLRAAVLERRGRLDDDTIERASQLMCERLEAAPVYEAATSIGGYSAIRGEIDPKPLLEDAIADGHAVYLPRVVDEHHLEFAKIDDYDALQVGAFGVLEPQGPPAELSEIDVFLIPGVAFDRNGGRIGFGRGYYDRILGRRLEAERADEAVFIGVCYDWQLVDDPIVVEPHDVAMDMIATDTEIICCGVSRS